MTIHNQTKKLFVSRRKVKLERSDDITKRDQSVYLIDSKYTYAVDKNSHGDNIIFTNCTNLLMIF